MAFAEANGARIYYDVVDRTAPWVTDPETIVFNHGIGIDHRMWTKWMPALMERYRIVLLDMRGFGQSTIPPADAKWSMDILVDDVFAVAKAAGAERFHLAGESMGGTVALCSYFRNPRALRTITVSNGAHLGASLENLNDWRDVIASGAMAGWSAMMSERRFYHGALPPDEQVWFDAAQRESSADSCMNALAVLRGIDLTAKLKDIAVPVFIVHGDASPFIPLTITAALHAGLPDSEVQVFPHAKHGLPLSHGTQCGRAMRAFLDRRAGR
jgi:pimeloyl-ACP methyl ester carboxylesterase